jgi:D-3-phosphoglycerate dehydrogenase
MMIRMKVLVADTLPQQNLQKLKQVVQDVEYSPDLTAESLSDHVSGVNILVVRGTKVSRQVIEKADSLELIVRSGAGTENIDLQAASAFGIFVTNCPDKNSAAVAELTMGLLLAVDRRIPTQDQALRAGKWSKQEFSIANGLKGRIFGVIGVGSVGREVVKRAKAFDMQVIAWSRSLTDEKARDLGILRASNVDELINKCDILSLHIQYTPETKHILSAERINRLNPGTIILNTSRGALIDSKALAQALAKGSIRAGLDVYENEPTAGKSEFNNIFTGIPNWVGTHHIGASTTQAQKATADEALRIIEHYIKTGHVEHCVNFAKLTPAICELMVRHYDKIGVLTRMLNDLREAKINVHGVHNIIFEGATAAMAWIELDTYPPQEVLNKISARKEEIIQIKVVTRDTATNVN